jgi:uncharacterized protein (DUF1015 family)
MTARLPHLLVADPHHGPAQQGGDLAADTSPEPADGSSKESFERLSAACAPGALLPRVPGSLEDVRRDAAELRRAVAKGAFHAPEGPTAVVYRLSTAGHQQTGVVVEVPVEDYRHDRVRRHEATHPDRERQLADFLAAARLELVPVTLTHATRPGLQALLDKVAAGTPDLQLTGPDEVTQTVWLASSPELVRAIADELAQIDVLYIADGHHRMAAARRHADLAHADLAHADLAHAGGACRACEFVLGAIFPAAEMRVLGYHRCVALPPDVADADVLARIAQQPVTVGVEECTADEAAQTEPGVVALHVGGRWHRVRLRPVAGRDDARDRLDVSMVEDGLIAPLLGVADVASDTRVTRFPGTTDAQAIAEWCAEHAAVGFLLHPPSVEQIMAVSDVGQIMPPKSTWFEPKAQAGLLLRDLSHAEPTT